MSGGRDAIVSWSSTATHTIAHVACTTALAERPSPRYCLAMLRTWHRLLAAALLALLAPPMVADHVCATASMFGNESAMASRGGRTALRHDDSHGVGLTRITEDVASDDMILPGLRNDNGPSGEVCDANLTCVLIAMPAILSMQESAVPVKIRLAPASVTEAFSTLAVPPPERPPMTCAVSRG